MIITWVLGRDQWMQKPFAGRRRKSVFNFLFAYSFRRLFLLDGLIFRFPLFYCHFLFMSFFHFSDLAQHIFAEMIFVWLFYYFSVFRSFLWIKINPFGSKGDENENRFHLSFKYYKLVSDIFILIKLAASSLSVSDTHSQWTINTSHLVEHWVQFWRMKWPNAFSCIVG